MREGSARALWGEEPRAFDQERRAWLTAEPAPMDSVREDLASSAGAFSLPCVRGGEGVG